MNDFLYTLLQEQLKYIDNNDTYMYFYICAYKIEYYDTCNLYTYMAKINYFLSSITKKHFIPDYDVY